MKFKKFKAGDEAFVVTSGWVTLEYLDNPIYPIQSGIFSYTEEGKLCIEDRYPSLLDYNPFDPNDPKNPPVYRSDWPFMLNGRRVKEGDILNDRSSNQNLPVRALYLEDGEVFCGLRGVPVSLLHPNHFCWPDELPKKKTTYLWAFPIHGNFGCYTVDFKRMTMEEGGKYAGAKIVPGTEEEE